MTLCYLKRSDEIYVYAIRYLPLSGQEHPGDRTASSDVKTTSTTRASVLAIVGGRAELRCVLLY